MYSDDALDATAAGRMGVTANDSCQDQLDFAAWLIYACLHKCGVRGPDKKGVFPVKGGGSIRRPQGTEGSLCRLSGRDNEGGEPYSRAE